MTWALDLDGVVWLAEKAVDGSPAAIDTLRAQRKKVVFLTNNSSRTVEDNITKLERIGVSAEPADVITSAEAAATLVEPGATVLVCAGPGVEEALGRRGVRTVRSGEADAVVVGWHADFDLDRLTAATSAVLGGARLVGTNDDAIFPSPKGPVPGGGAILAAVSYATGVGPEVAGKPYAPIASLLRDRVGTVEVVVGDRPSTDGRLARRLGARFGLVLSGVTAEADLPVEPPPDIVAADLAELVATT